MTQTTPVSKAKMWVAAIGSTLTALLVFLTPLGGALEDGKLDGGEVAGLVVTFISLVGTVYGVWRVRNKPVQPK